MGDYFQRIDLKSFVFQQYCVSILSFNYFCQHLLKFWSLIWWYPCCVCCLGYKLHKTAGSDLKAVCYFMISSAEIIINQSFFIFAE